MNPEEIKSIEETPLFARGKVIGELWARALPIPGRNANQWRTDRDGNLIHRACYMNLKSAYGWKVNMELNSEGTVELNPVHNKHK